MTIGGATCVVSIPAAEVAFRNMSVPFKNPKKIRQILPFELESTLPVSIENLSIDFFPLKRSDLHSGTDIIVGCVEKDRLSTYLTTLSKFNLHPDIVTVSGFPITYCLSKQSDFPENGLILDIGNKTVTLFVIVSHQIHLIRVLSFRNTGESRVQLLSQRIRHTLYAFEDILGRNLQIEELIITGNGADNAKLPSDLSGYLGISVRSSNLAEVLDFRFKKEPGNLWNPSLMDSTLALGQMELEGSGIFNFRKRSFLEKQFWAEHGKRIVHTGVLATIVLLVSFFHILFDTYALQRKVVQTDQKIAAVFQKTFPEVKRIVDPLHQMRVKIENVKTIAVFPGESDNRYRTIDVLNHISKQLPQVIDTEITRLVISPENTLISGNTDTFNTVDDIKNRLEAAAIFRKVTISSANMDRSDNRVRFKIKIDLAQTELPGR